MLTLKRTTRESLFSRTDLLKTCLQVYSSSSFPPRHFKILSLSTHPHTYSFYSISLFHLSILSHLSLTPCSGRRRSGPRGSAACAQRRTTAPARIRRRRQPLARIWRWRWAAGRLGRWGGGESGYDDGDGDRKEGGSGSFRVSFLFGFFIFACGRHNHPAREKSDFRVIFTDTSLQTVGRSTHENRF